MTVLDDDLLSDSASWLYAGLASDFPNIIPSISSTRLTDSITSSSEPSFSEDQVPVCRILQTSTTPPALLDPSDALGTVGLQEQVLIFQYRGKFHAVDHQCPHRSFPLSRGSLNDIEDFGIVLSVSLTCQKHGWDFDVITGESDRGAYRLNVWDVDVRTGADDAREIWVRKKPRK